MITIIILLIMLISISTAISIKAKIEQEKAMVIGFISIGIVLFLLSIINMLKYSILIISSMSVIAIIYIIIKLIKKETKIKEIFTIPVCLYIIGSFILYTILKNATVQEYDEFMFWATNLKAMYATDLVWANELIEGIHQVYPPLSGLIEYFFCKINGNYNEGIIYLAINMFMLVMLLPIMKEEKYDKIGITKAIIKLCIPYCFMLFFDYELETLAVDALLGFMLLLGIYIAYKAKEKQDYVMILFLNIALTITKSNGIIFTGIILMIVFFNKVILNIIQDRKITKQNLKQIGIIISIILICVSFFCMWNIYCKINGKELDDRHDKNYTNQIDLNELIKGIFRQETENDHNKKVVRSFYRSITKSESTNTKITITTLQIIIAINLIYILKIIISQNKKKLISTQIALNIGLIIYLISLLATYMFIFTNYEGEITMEYPRYISTYLLAFAVFTIYIWIEEFNIIKTCIMFAIIIIFLAINTKEMTLLHKNEEEYYEDIKYVAESILDVVKKDDKIYIFDMGIETGQTFQKIRYLIAPIKTNLLYEWNIETERTKETLIKTLIISPEEFKNKIKEEEYQYMFFYREVPEKFIEEYGDIIEVINDKEIMEGTVYKIIEVTDKIYLEY